MRPGRRAVLLAMAGGALWALGVLWLGARVRVPVFALVPAISLAFLGPGLVLAAMIGRMAQRRFFDLALIDGAHPAPGSGADIDRRVLANTVEQVALALCIWPALAVLLGTGGAGVVITLGVAFTAARLLFWAGYRRRPVLRGFGFAASFYPTVFAGLWALWLIAGFF